MYVVELDFDDDPRRLEARPAHRERLQALSLQGTLVLAGPWADDAGAMLVFDLASEVEYRGGAISGEWTEASRNASGTIEGRAAGDRIEAAATGPSFSAALSLTTRGSRQTVTIRPQGTDISTVSLELSRR